MNWYVRAKRDGKTQGPFAEDRIAWNVEQGNLRPDMWFSEDGEQWVQHPAALFPPQTDRTVPSKPAGAQPADSVVSEHEVTRASRSNAPWLSGGVTVVLLLFALGLDQWATTRMTLKGIGGKEYSSAMHYGRASMAAAVDAPGRERAIKIDEVFYADLLDTALLKAEAEETIRNGKLLLWLIFLACAARLAGSYLVWRAPRFSGRPGGIYMLGTLPVIGVGAAALMFNSGGLVTTALPEMLGAALSPGFGFSTWIALLAVVLDAFGILAVKVACTPHATRIRRHRHIN